MVYYIVPPVYSGALFHSGTGEGGRFVIFRIFKSILFFVF